MPDETTGRPDQHAADAGPVTDAATEATRALDDAQHAVDAIEAQTAPASGEPDPHSPNFDLPTFQNVMADVKASGIELLRDVDLNVKIELGRTDMLVEDVLALDEGSVVELNKLAGDPVDIYVNDRLVARGEVLVLSENFCVRVNEVISDPIDADAASADGGDGQVARAQDTEVEAASRTRGRAAVEAAGPAAGG